MCYHRRLLCLPALFAVVRLMSPPAHLMLRGLPQRVASLELARHAALRQRDIHAAECLYAAQCCQPARANAMAEPRHTSWRPASQPASHHPAGPAKCCCVCVFKGNREKPQPGSNITSVGKIVNVLFQYQSTHDNKGIPTVSVYMTGCVIT